MRSHRFSFVGVFLATAVMFMVAMLTAPPIIGSQAHVMDMNAPDATPLKYDKAAWFGMVVLAGECMKAMAVTPGSTKATGLLLFLISIACLAFIVARIVRYQPRLEVAAGVPRFA